MIKIKNVLIVFLFGFHASLYASTAQQSWLDNKIRSFIKGKPVKAMVYGLWINGKPISVQAIGSSMTSVPATKDMSFRIGGVTETLLTTALMLLVEKKELTLEDKVARWYPNLPNADQVDLKMLANGTSGYPDYVYNEDFIKAVIDQPFKQWSDKELIDYAFLKEPLFKPGTSQHYSHTDYVILGSILAQASNQPLNLLLHSLIFKKLKMEKTRFERTATIPCPALHSFSQDRGVYEDATFWDPSWTASSGATTSTIEDLGTWANAWMNGNLLTDKSTEQLRATDTVGKGKNTSELFFAMGFGVANHWLMQNPRFGGYSGVFAVLPEKEIVFIAFNTLKPTTKETSNLSVDLWKELVSLLAPDYPVPDFN
ncbi:serine hydrolase domain-containing protein [Legionella parisiensis]|uniref:D-alanyl-D-alanine carboxypeptidase n=1 Tax=Legionella parisiensis TaxID=45071 RepID=A0A1E5JRX6_9GAMM|nr:serine hydrolase domain-containing protein [Legionella parisiensis]KTD41068.1 serine-type D-Ala-D-Ala carboxypeptidase [Legionella parisiensis]OEH47286.1 D-alanyl-D-alanine carboxypeptidase [Legionella parisiensis]STX76639.1 serine-type D-Ala-D-Ala carboxypeptidase [Legionella parisiensis]